jgi:hypothetical protein
MRKRTKQVIVRLSSEEHALLLAKMELSGLSCSALFRKILRDDNIPVYPVDDMKDLLAHISKIGSNINQIARVANSTQTADASMLTETSFQIDKLRRYIKELGAWR